MPFDRRKILPGLYFFFKNPGRKWHPQGEPEQVRVYDFSIRGLGRATPYGVYDLGQNAGWESAGNGS